MFSTGKYEKVKRISDLGSKNFQKARLQGNKWNLYVAKYFTSCLKNGSAKYKFYLQLSGIAMQVQSLSTETVVFCNILI